VEVRARIRHSQPRTRVVIAHHFRLDNDHTGPRHRVTCVQNQIQKDAFDLQNTRQNRHALARQTKPKADSLAVRAREGRCRLHHDLIEVENFPVRGLRPRGHQDRTRECRGSLGGCEQLPDFLGRFTGRNQPREVFGTAEHERELIAQIVNKLRDGEVPEVESAQAVNIRNVGTAAV
jgi:hypothetical protein